MQNEKRNPTEDRTESRPRTEAPGARMPAPPGAPGTGGGDFISEAVPNPDLDLVEPDDVEPDLVNENRSHSPANFRNR